MNSLFNLRDISKSLVSIKDLQEIRPIEPVNKKDNFSERATPLVSL